MSRVTTKPVYVISEQSDQGLHCLFTVTPIVAISEIPKSLLASVPEQVG